MSKRPVGRPPGLPSPRKVLETDIREAAKLNRQIRDLVSGQVTLVQKELGADETSLEKRLSVIKMLSEALQVQTSGMDKTAKHLLDVDSNDEDSSTTKETPAEDVLAILTGVRR